MRGRARVIAIKENVELCPWADLVYGCDAAWWQFRRGLKEFKGLKVCFRGNGLADFPEIQRVDIAPGNKLKYSDQIQMTPGVVGGGGNSGFQALDLAAQFGGNPILLIGFDMHDTGGKHWYGRNNWPMSNNPDIYNFRRWIEAFAQAAPGLAARGVKVFNCSPNSALRCFPFADIEQAIASRDIGMDRVRSA